MRRRGTRVRWQYCCDMHTTVGAAAPSRLGRAAFALLLPAMALPAIGIGLAFWLPPLDLPDGGDRSITLLAVGVFMFVLLGSMTLNAWLLLRQPAVWRSRSLPPGVSVIQIGIVAVVAGWEVQLVVAPEVRAELPVGVVVMVLAIAHFIALMRTRPRSKERFAPFAPARPARVLLRLYIVAAIGAGIASLVVVGLALSGFAFATWWMPVAFVIGLPWSHTALALTIVGAMFVPGSAPAGGLITMLVLVVPLVINILIARELLASPDRAAAAANRVFLLREDLRQPTAPPLIELPAQKEPPPWERDSVSG
jgi:hypothetical protein